MSVGKKRTEDELVDEVEVEMMGLLEGGGEEEEEEEMRDSDDDSEGYATEGEAEDMTDKIMREQEVEGEGEGQIEKLAGHVIDDLKRSLWEMRYVGLISAFIGFVIALQLTVTPYRVSDMMSRTNVLTMQDLHAVRPVLSPPQLHTIQKDTMTSETEFWLPDEFNTRVKLRFHNVANRGGSFMPPGIFYEGVVYGVSAKNSHGVTYSSTLTSESHQEMDQALSKLQPPPTAIMRRMAANNATGWEEEGYGIFYSYADLLTAGKLSSDKLAPWSRIEESVLTVARNFKQVCVFRWHPHTFGKPRESEMALTGRSLRDYVSIIQQVVPTRTGLDALKSSVVVWASQMNSKDLEPIPDVVRKEWSSSDHWTHYLN